MRCDDAACNVSVWLMVPAKTASPGVLSTGGLSLVAGAWSTLALQAATTPSSATRPPGLTHRGADRNSAHGHRIPPTSRLLEVGGVRRKGCQAADGVAGAVDGTRHEFRNGVQRHDHRCFGPWPKTKAPMTATVIKALMFAE